MQPAALTLNYKQAVPVREAEPSAQQAASWLLVDVATAGDLAELARLLDLVDRADSGTAIFQTAGWLGAAAEAVLSRANSRVHVAIAMQSGLPVAALPVCIRQIAG